MKEAYDLVSRKYGKGKAQELFEINPLKIIKDEII